MNDLRDMFDGRGHLAAAAIAWVVVPIVIVAGAAYVFLPNGVGTFLAGLLIGVGITATAGLFAWGFIMRSGVTWMQGEMGESFTRDTLKAAVKDGTVYGCVDNIHAGAGDIDHLVFGPFGAVAIESKLKTRPDTDRLIENTSEAASHARTAQAVLRSVDINYPMPVQPVVVVWGKGSTHLPTPERCATPRVDSSKMPA